MCNYLLKYKSETRIIIGLVLPHRWIRHWYDVSYDEQVDPTSDWICGFVVNLIMWIRSGNVADFSYIDDFIIYRGNHGNYPDDNTQDEAKIYVCICTVHHSGFYRYCGIPPTDGLVVTNTSINFQRGRDDIMIHRIKTSTLRGSATIEAAVIVPMILFLCMSIILAVFYFHDKNILIGVAAETAIMAAANHEGHRQISEDDIRVFFQERIEKKLIFFPEPDITINKSTRYYEITGTTSKLRFTYTFQQRARIFEAEEWIRKKKTVTDIFSD